MVMELTPSTPCRLTMERADDGDGDGLGLDLKLCLGVGVPGPLKTPNTSVSEEDRAALESRMRCSRARDRVAREHEVLSGERRKSSVRCPSVAPISSPSPKPHPNSFWQQCSVPMMYTYPCHQVQYVPVDNEFKFPCVMPCWAPTVSAAAGGLNRACSGFPGHSSVAEAGNPEIKADSTGSASSAISNQPSISVRGGSTCSGDSFINTHPKAQKNTSKAESCLMENTSSSACPRALERVHSVTKPCRDRGSEKPSPLPRMPLVSTTGNGPNGRTINGFLYRYTKSEVKILCVCHGSSFTPAEFVRHAGGTNVAQPMKEIVVVTVAGERNCSVYV